MTEESRLVFLYPIKQEIEVYYYINEGNLMADMDMKFLVVDDMLTMRKILIRMLNDLGYEKVEFAEDGEEAFELLNSHFSKNDPFDFVFTDINMPNWNGIRLLTEIRKHENFKKMPVLVISAEVESESIKEIMLSGATTMVRKPFDKEKIKEKIDFCLNKIKDD